MGVLLTSLLGIFTRNGAGTWWGAAEALAHIVRTQGVLGLYQGHSLTLARAVPHAAIGYTVYDTARKILIPSESHATPIRRLIAGSIAGVSVLPFTHPFELVRVRMALKTKHSRTQPNLVSVFRGIYKEPTPYPRSLGGITNFYRGFVVTFVGTVPYRGGIFLVWETLNSQIRQKLSPSVHEANRHKIHLVVGAIAGTTSQIVTYPLEVIRRIQQASGHGSNGSRMISSPSFRKTALDVWRTAGWRGFYAGLGIGLIKQVPMHSISLSVWQAAKRILDI